MLDSGVSALADDKLKNKVRKVMAKRIDLKLLKKNTVKKQMKWRIDARWMRLSERHGKCNPAHLVLQGN